MHQKDVILFDLDGTLTDPAIGITNGARKGLAVFGIEEPDREALYPFIGPPLMDSFQKLYGLSEEQAKAAVCAYREYYGVTGLFENEVYPGIPELLKGLQEAGKTIVLATSKPEEFSVRILERFGLLPYFDHVGAASMDGVRSAKADVIRHALALCGEPDRQTVVMVGDRLYDVLGAKETGLESIGVVYGYGSRAELEQAGATWIAETVSDLKKLLLD